MTRTMRSQEHTRISLKTDPGRRERLLNQLEDAYEQLDQALANLQGMGSRVFDQGYGEVFYEPSYVSAGGDIDEIRDRITTLESRLA